MKKFLSVFLSVFVFLCVISVVPKAKAERFFADGYNGSTYEGAGIEVISYSKKDDQEIYIAGGLPKYYNAGTNHNTCANVAGAIVLGYYDKEYDNLIMDFQAARTIRDKIIFSAQTNAVQTVIDDLYIKMQTNKGGEGTTIDCFKSGLQSYVQEKSMHIQYNSLVLNQELNFDLYKSAIDDKKPIVLFASKYTLVSLRGITENDKNDEYAKLYYGGDHVLIGYGIREINYYDEQGMLNRQVKCLLAATGYEQDSLAYILLDDRIKIIDGYSVSIY